MGAVFIYDGDDQRMAKPIALAMQILTNEAFRALIENRSDQFFNTGRTCQEIARLIFETDVSVTIREFSKRPWFGRLTTAFVDPRNRDQISFNTYAMGRGDAANTNTLVHEFVHIIDYFHDTNSNADFTHKGQKPFKPPQNQQSAPYWIGNRAEDLVRAEKSNNKSGEKAFTISSFSPSDIESVITERNWAGDEGFICASN